MNVRYVISRFNQMKHDYIGTTSCFKTVILWVDYLCALLVHGASISDYFAYGFYKLRFNGRCEYITYRRYNKILRKCNDKNDIAICRDKLTFNSKFSDLLGREWLDVSIASFAEFDAFVQRHNTFFMKDVLGFRGVGITRHSMKDIDISALYSELKGHYNVHYVLEEEITEVDILKDFHPWSVNTIRVVTLYDDVEDKVYVMNAMFRMGNCQNNVDNFHYRGIGANVDLSTGIVASEGYDAKNNIYMKHPLTNKQIIGFQIPYWEECLDFVKKAARRIPTVRYVGWDVVIKPGGTFALIEANDNADHDIQQLHNKGLWKEYKAVVKKF